uniref:C-type lectin domain-containing protein n=1 Tax=Astyanax mexicanus TaxID=7994 RepID=A0A8B9LRE9_ASTMX
MLMCLTHFSLASTESGAGPCVTMTTKPTAGFWVNRNCDQSHPFICEIPRDGISPPTKEYTNKKSWAGAHEDCVARGADLVSIHNAEEEIFMAEYTKGKTQWIGLSRNALEGDYLWSDGSALSHTNWGPGEPNDHAGRENCVELVTTQNGSSYWNDIFCDAHQDWVCMISKYVFK